MKKIWLRNRRKYTLIDDDDFDRVKKYIWAMKPNGYAYRTSKSIYLHRFIMRANIGQYVDHINGKPLDNQKHNLRFCSFQQNTWNRHTKGTQGVSFTESKKWRAYIFVNKKQKWLGIYDKKEDALRAFNTAAVFYRGKYAFINKIPQGGSNGKEIKKSPNQTSPQM